MTNPQGKANGISSSGLLLAPPLGIGHSLVIGHWALGIARVPVFSYLPAVRMLKLLLPVLLVLGSGLPALAASSKIVKVLPQYLDREGRHTVSPSLYDRDAYQVHLRRHPEERSGIRFAIQWKAPHSTLLKLRVEMRGARGMEPTTALLEEPVQRRGLFSNWSSPKLTGENYKKFGELVAWRATLWDGTQQVAEQRSFLW